MPVDITENYIRIRMRDPNDFQDGSFRTIDISKSKGIKAIIGRLKGETTTTVQSYLFDKDKWTVAEAKKWIEEHEKGIMDKLHIKADIEKKDGKIIGIASEEVEDRDGEVLSIEGWDLKNFKKNPQLLWYHNLRPERSLPIGRAEHIKIQEINGKKKLVFEAVFEEITEFGRTVKQFVLDNFLNCFSVGFMPLERDGNKYTKQELLEISLVPVPALPSAEIIQRAEDEGMNKIAVKALLGDEEATKKILEDGKDELDGGELNKGESKAVVPYQGHTPAPEGKAWDARTAENRIRTWVGGPDKDKIDWNKYKQGFTWFDSKDAESISAYKLPHHDIEGNGMITVWRGVAAAMAALLGARGGVQIPDGDRKGVYNHLKSHYGQFDKEVPDYRLVEEQVLKGLDEEIMSYVELLEMDKLFKMFKNIRWEVRKAVQKKQKSNQNDLGVNKIVEALKIINLATKSVNQKGGE